MEPPETVFHGRSHGQIHQKHFGYSEILFIPFITNKINPIEYELLKSALCFCAPVYFKPETKALYFRRVFVVSLYVRPEIGNDRDRAFSALAWKREAGRIARHGKPGARLLELVFRVFSDIESDGKH